MFPLNQLRRKEHENFHVPFNQLGRKEHGNFHVSCDNFFQQAYLRRNMEILTNLGEETWKFSRSF